MSRCLVGLLALVWISCFAAAQAPLAAPDPMLMQRRLAAVLRQSRDHYNAGEYGAALERLGVLQGPAAADTDALNLRGAILLRMGKADEARQIFRSILDANASYFPATYNLGEVEYVSGNYEKALEQFEAMRRSDPRNEIVRFKCFASLLALGREPEARNLVDAMIPAGSTPAWYYAQAALALDAKDPGKAKKYTAAAKAIYPEDDCKAFDEAMAAMKQ